jgi:hypothetical protein
MANASSTQPVLTPASQFPTRTVHVDGDVISYTLELTSAQMWDLHDTMMNTEIALEISIEEEETSAWMREKGTQRIAESKRLRLALMGIYED